MNPTKQQVSTAAILLAQEVELLHSLMSAAPAEAEIIKSQIQTLWVKQVETNVSLDFLVCRLRGIL